MHVGSDNWGRHWKTKHGIKRKGQWKEYKMGDEIPEPYFVTKPRKGEDPPEEDFGEMNADVQKAHGRALSDFILTPRDHQLKDKSWIKVSVTLTRLGLNHL